MWADHSIVLGNDTAAPRHVGTRGRRDTAVHGLPILVDPPLGVGTRDEATLGIPTGDPVQAVIEKEEAQGFGTTALVQRGREPAGALVELGLEHVAVENATVDQGGGDLLVVLGPVAADQMPATTREEVVSARDGSLPMLFAIDGTVDPITVLEPVLGTAEGANAEEEVGSHDWRMTPMEVEV